MAAQSRNTGTIKQAIATQRHGKQMPAEKNKYATIEDAVFTVRSVLGNGSVNTLSRRRICTQ
jgi:hypothetical protein